MNREQAAVVELARSVVSDVPVDPRWFEAIDWTVFLQALQRHKIFSLCYEKIKAMAPTEVRGTFDSLYQAHVDIIDERIHEIHLLFERAKEQGVNIVLNKGIALSVLIYDNPYMRDARDIDLLINDEEIEEVNAFLNGCGFYCAIGKDDPYRIDRTNPDNFHYLDRPVLKTAEHHEYFEYWKPTRDGRYVVLEAGRYLHESVKDIASFLQTARYITIQGNDHVRACDLEHTYIVLLENAYNDAEGFFESIPSLKNYIDMALFAQKYHAVLNWERVNRLIRQFQLHRAFERVVAQAHALFPALDASCFAHTGEPEDADGAADSPFLYDWEMEIGERLFLDPQERERLVAAMSKKLGYSDMNARYRNPLETTSGAWQPLAVNDERIALNYKFDYRSDQLVLQLNIDQLSLNRLTEHHEIHIFLIDPEVDSPDFFTHHVVICKVNGRLEPVESSLFDHVRRTEAPKRYSHLEHLADGVLVYLSLDAIDPAGKIGYCIGIVENLLGKIPHWITPMPYDKKFWAAMPVVALPIKAKLRAGLRV